MNYHDNMAFFKMACDCTLKGGTYTIEESKVTSGQDPDAFVTAVRTIPFDIQSYTIGEMTFKVGRKGSQEVANWFNDNVHANQTTFNDKADSLNFAFIGKLVLKLDCFNFGEIDTPYVECIFEKIAIAQGETGDRNNWWFGGNNCSHVRDNVVKCNGILIINENNSVDVTMEVLRGGNSVNEFKIVSVTKK